jgi:hypothetical protein
MADEAWTRRILFDMVFPGMGRALAIRLDDLDVSELALDVLGLRRPYPTLVLVGGAGDMGNSQMKDLRPLFVDTLAPLAGDLGTAVVDGGTDAGVMRLMGQARAETGGTFPLIGVVASGTVILPGADSQAHPDKVPLEPHHTHFLLVPGCDWGDESLWIASIASALSHEAPSVTILVDGGEIALEDVERSVEHHRPVVVVANTGRAADRLTVALRGQVSDERAQALVASGLLRVVDRAEGSHRLMEVIREALSIGG